MRIIYQDRYRFFFSAILAGSVLLTGAPVLGADFHSPRTEGLGGAGHAGPSLNDAIYLNPSFTSLIQTYSVAFNYLSFDGGDVQPDGSNAIHGRTVNVSLLDGRSELFQAGVGYTRRDGSNLISLGASKAIVQQWGVGIGGKILSPTDPLGNTVHDTTLSVTFMPSGSFQVAAMVDNLLETNEGKNWNLYREFILGSKFAVPNIVTVYFDPHWAPTLADQTFGYEFGAELTFLQDFFFRLGKFKNSMIPSQKGVRGDGYGAGLGWTAPRLSLDYAASHSVTPDAQVVHTFGATIFF